MKVIYLGNPILRKKAKEIEKYDEKLKKFAEEMAKVMYRDDGVGLAAPQVSESVRMFVFDAGEGLNTVINPEILKRNEKKVKMEEGCLSIPGIYADVFRPEEVEVKYFDVAGKECHKVLTGYAARVFQHEFDHLEGILFIDYLSTAKKAVLRSKLNKIKKGEVL